MASELRVNTLKDAAGANSVATSVVASGSAKAWFEMGADFLLDDSHNIASMTDDGTGLFTYTYTNNMSSANYAPNAGPTGGARNTVFIWVETTSLTSSGAAASMGTQNGGSTALADSENCMALHGDLA
jgi:hypothetical protein